MNRVLTDQRASDSRSAIAGLFYGLIELIGMPGSGDLRQSSGIANYTGNRSFPGSDRGRWPRRQLEGMDYMGLFTVDGSAAAAVAISGFVHGRVGSTVGSAVGLAGFTADLEAS
jgi:hypothetical protein